MKRAYQKGFVFIALLIVIVFLGSFNKASAAAPVLDASKTPVFSAMTEDDGAPTGAVGTPITNLVDFTLPAGGLDNVTDADGGALLGVAIVATDSASLTCYYTLNSGVTWTPVGAVSSASARLLAANGTNRIYCQPGLNANGTFTSVITYRAWDQTSGVDGSLADTSTNGGATAFSSATDTANLTVIAVDDAPTGTNINAAEAYTEDTSLNLTDIVVSDVDNATLQVGLILSDPAAGSLSTGTSGAVTSTYNASSGLWQATGSIADINALLAGVTFTPSLNYNSNFTIQVALLDGILSATVGNKNMTGTAVNDAPAATNLSTAETYTENTALDLTDIVVSDIDSATVTATLTLSNPAAGSLTPGSTGPVTATYDTGTGVWTVTGALADVNILLAYVKFVPAAGVSTNVTITTLVSDGVAADLTGSKTVTGIATVVVSVSSGGSVPVAFLSNPVPSVGGIVPVMQSGATAPTAQSKYIFIQTLKLGADNTSVQRLQEFLNTHGAQIASSGAGSPGNEVTTFGKKTMIALSKYQKAHGIIPASGYFGPITMKLVNSEIEAGK